MLKFAAALFALMSVTPATAAETKPMTPPGAWMKVIKDAVRTQLKQPEIVTFNRIFYVDVKAGDGSYPVCGFVSFKQEAKKHPEKQPFQGRFTPNGTSGTVSGLELGQTDAQKLAIADACKKSGIQ